tara:strand:- start:2209 stop:3159 length:951 start_codon:yes stop_codon:yes gene_type:complete
MPNILKRPMFRKGGSVAYGTGITSGLEERKNYQFGGMNKDGVMIGEMGGIGPGGVVEELITDPTRKLTDAEAEKIALSQLEQEANQPILPEIDPRRDDVLQQMGIMSAIEGAMEPTGEEVVADTMAALASTAPDDPTKLQTFGQVLGKAGAAARGLEKEREKGIREFRKEAGLQILKNMTSEEKDQLFRYAKKYSETTGMPVEEAYKMFLDRYLQGTPAKGLTEEQLYQTNIDRYLKTIRRPNIEDAQTVARTMTKIQKGQTGGISGAPIEGGAFKDEKGAVDAGAEIGRNYINPRDGKIYRYDGKGKFTQVWPSK